MSKTLAFLMCLILSTPIIIIFVISLTYNYNINNENRIERYLESDNCYIENIIKGEEYYFHRDGHKIKAMGKDKTEYKCTDGNSYIR